MIWLISDLPLLGISMILCADLLLFVFTVTFPLSLLNTWSVVHTFHTRQNNGYKKRARDKLYFSIPARLKASFRLLINRNFPVKPFKDSSLSLPQLTMSICPCRDALRVGVRQQALVRHTHPQDYCICVCDLSFVVVYVFKNPASLWGWKQTCLFSSSSTKNQS